MMVILFLLVAVGFALVSLSFCIYNARKVPYQSIKGHKGLYLWNFIAGEATLPLKKKKKLQFNVDFFECLFLYFPFLTLPSITLPLYSPSLTCAPLSVSSSFRGPGPAVLPGSREAPQHE